MKTLKKKKFLQNLFYDLVILSLSLSKLQQKSMKGFYHISSSGLERNDIFRSREDFIRGMNDIALTVLGFDISILAFCLMSNHFHFILYGTREQCLKFAEEYKRRCAMRMRQAYGCVQGLQNLKLQVNYIDTEQYLENAIVYVLRNSLAAGICMIPYFYPWSSLAAYFNGGTKPRSFNLNEMSFRKRCGILKSESTVPSHYCVDENGIILPECYVDVKRVEGIFKHPARFLNMLSRKVEGDVEIKFGIADTVSLTDQEIATQMKELIYKEFQKESLSQLSMEQRLTLCSLLKKNFRAGAKQIARISHLPLHIIEQIV